MNFKDKFTYPEYFYGYYNLLVKDNEYKLGVNDHSISVPIDRLTKFLDSLEEEIVILCVRGEREPFMLPFPALEQINHLKDACNKKILVFNQQPWPAPIPDFETEGRAVVVKFGYDEECELDKLTTEEDMQSTEHEDYEGPILINKNKVIKL